MKKCHKCGETKPCSEFSKATRLPDGLQAACKKCKNAYYKNNYDKWRKSDIKRRYGLTAEEYFQIKQSQNAKCYICGKTEQENKRALAIDHCHTSNKVRKLLCDTCNRVLGLVKENKKTLHSMISYLEEHDEQSRPRDARIL